MVGVIVISENKTASEYLKTLRRLLGSKQVKGIESLVIRSNFDTRTLKAKLNRMIRKLNADEGILILNDLYGSTQCNICKEFIQKNAIELITGYNLPMLVKVATLNQSVSLKDLAKQALDAGQKYMKRFN